jgi:tRNA threonylcarbamoyladenosine biosynthesis protein TsaB
VNRFQPPVCLLIDTASRQGIVALGPSSSNGQPLHHTHDSLKEPQPISRGCFGFAQVEQTLGQVPIESCGWEIIPGDPGVNRRLVPAIQQLLARFSIPIEQILPLAVIQGPGSFTGIRVGVATAKTLAYAASIPLLPVDALEALAIEGWLTVGRQAPIEIGVLMDAYRGEFFWGRWRWDQQGWRTMEPSRLLRATEETPGCPPGMQSIVCGPGIAVLDRKNQLASWRDAGWLTLNEPIPVETAARARLLLAHLLYETIPTLDPFSLLPIYLRGSAAEEKAEGKAASPAATRTPGSIDE